MCVIMVPRGTCQVSNFFCDAQNIQVSYYEMDYIIIQCTIKKPNDEERTDTF